MVTYFSTFEPPQNNTPPLSSSKKKKKKKKKLIKCNPNSSWKVTLHGLFYLK